MEAARAPVGWAAASAIFAVALAVRLVHVWQIRGAPFFTVLMGDARAYDEWAQQIARGDWLGQDVFYQAPLYPYFLGTLYSIAGRDLLFVRLCQGIVGSLSCVLLGLAGARLISKKVGVVAGLGLALYAPAIFFDALIQKSVLDVFFVCLVIWLISRLVSEPQTRLSWLWTGLAMGGLSLTRENALVFILVIVAWGLARRPDPDRTGDPRAHAAAASKWQARAGPVGVFLLGLTIVLLPVAVRNSVVGGGFYLTTAQFGPNFYIGNNARADGTYMSLRFGRGAPEYEREDATELAEEATGRRLSPAEVSSYWTGQALAFIRSEPVAWLRLLGRKAALLWNRTEMLDTESQESHAEWSTPLRAGGLAGHFGVLVPLAVLGLIVTWPHRHRLWVIYGISTAYAASVVMFYVFARYRYPLVPFLLIFAAAGLVALPRLLEGHLRPVRATVLVAALLGVAVFANWPMLSPDLMRAITEHNLGAALQSEGRVDEAIDHYRRAVALRADYAPAYSNMGAALRAKGQLPDAVDAYEQALALRPDYREARYNLANALLEQGELDAAVEQFRGVLRATPSADAHNNLGIALAAKGRSEEALAEFREAVRLDPGSSMAHRNLGDALASAGMRAEGMEHLRRATELDPRDGSAHYNLGSLLLEMGRFTDAIDRFRTALQLMPDSADVHNNLGIALASQGDIEGAIDHLQRALALQPGLVDAQQNLAKLRGQGVRPR
ncbi:MAG: tetratricopeptide repeat protein [Vicinamibacterales bacterium]